MAKITDQLSSEAQGVMVAGFRSKKPCGIISTLVKTATGEVVSERTMARRKAEWEAEQQRRQSGREQMEDLLGAMRNGNATASEMVNALALEALMRDPEGFATLNPIDVQRTSIAAERVRIQSARLDLQQRQVALEERKLALLEQQREGAIRAAEELESKANSGKAVTADDLRRIREVYGLTN